MRVSTFHELHIVWLLTPIGTPQSDRLGIALNTLFQSMGKHERHAVHAIA